MNKNIVLALMFFLIGCSTNSSYLKMHAQEALPKSQVALLKPVAFIQIHEIDSVKTSINPSGPGLSTTEYDIELLPGDHVLKVSYDTGTYHSIGFVEMKILLDANKKYILRPTTSRKSWWNPTKEWEPVLLDVTDKNECWTLNVGALGGPKGCE